MDSQPTVLEALEAIKVYCDTEECETCILYDVENEKCPFYQSDKVPCEWKNKATFSIKTIEL